jgi:hypothetical protein
MKEIFASSDPGEIAFLQSVFEDAGIKIFLFDQHTSQMLGGLGGGFTPCRIMVSESDYEAALDILDEIDAQLDAEEQDDE